MTKYTPIGNRILLRTPIIESNDTTVGGIIIPKEQVAMHRAKTESPFLKLVVDASGPECKQIHVGDTVIINRHQVHPLPIDGENLYFVAEEVVVAIVRA